VEHSIYVQNAKNNIFFISVTGHGAYVKLQNPMQITEQQTHIKSTHRFLKMPVQTIIYRYQMTRTIQAGLPSERYAADHRDKAKA
jgi:hypothetical protein